MTERPNQRPWMTVVIATYNSAKFLPGLAEMLARQVAPDGEERLEVLVVDGGSTDGSPEIARDLGFVVLNNPAGHAIAAKNLGLRHSSSRLVCILDHDEKLVQIDSLKRRFLAFKQYPSLRAMISAGYLFEPDEPAANMYASEFGDPVSMSIYRTPNSEQFRLSIFRRRLQSLSSNDGVHIFRAGTESRPVLCEMAAGSGVIDLDFFKERHPEVITEENAFPHAYYFLGSNDQIGMIEGDNVLHSSAEDWSVVRAKIAWRINNAINGNAVTQSGFKGRAHSRLYSPKRHALLFGLYAGSIVLPLADSLILALSRRKIGYLNHFVLTYFVIWKVVSLRVSGLTGGKRGVSRYGE